MIGPPVPSISEIPYDDADRLLRWVELNSARVTPFALERLLGHFGFVDAGQMPTAGAAECIVWKHQRASHPRFTNFRILVYHTETVAVARVAMALALLREVRRVERHLDSQQSST